MGETITLDQVLTLAEKLSARDKVRLIEFIAPQIAQAIPAQPQKPLRSLYGLWRGFSITEEDIAQARREMWGNFGEREF
ncbi:hypothetical protein FBQ82_05410 [Anaerolineae bacterium CFX7]|nr:hypothetical protein [Anaerolineae bacterium CFX7]